MDQNGMYFLDAETVRWFELQEGIAKYLAHKMSELTVERRALEFKKADLVRGNDDTVTLDIAGSYVPQYDPPPGPSGRSQRRRVINGLSSRSIRRPGIQQA